MRQGDPRILNIPTGVEFLPALAKALLSGRLVPDFVPNDDPLALADVTIYLPTRRAARELRSVFVDLLGGRAAILPTIRPLGEVDEDADIFADDSSETLDIPPAIARLERVLLLAPLVQAWKRRLPAHVANLMEEEIVVPASAADAIWLARDLADLIDEVETEGADWNALSGLVPDELAGWWQVTLEFLQIVRQAWPQYLAESGLSNPAAHRDRTLRAEASRLKTSPPPGPVIAAGSTGTIPATAELLSVIARLPQGAVVLPGLDTAIDEESWQSIGRIDVSPSSFGHPQTALKRLLERLGIERGDIQNIGEAPRELAARARLVSEALRPAETTDSWPLTRAARETALAAGAFEGISLVEAGNEREEALAIAIALRLAVEEPGHIAALVTSDRALARRVSAELERFGIRADDSGGVPLATTPPVMLADFALQAILAPGDPLTLHSLLGHPLLGLGLPRPLVRRAAETIELVALRGGTGRPDIADLAQEFDRRLAAVESSHRKPFWRARLDAERVTEARRMLAALHEAIAPLVALRDQASANVGEATRATVLVLEGLARGEDGSVAGYYDGEAGTQFAGLLRELIATETGLAFHPREWPQILSAIVAGGSVKPAPGGDGRVFIWGALEARLQSVDTLVLGGLNEGSWPRRAESDRFMSRLMKAGLDLEPPERRIGQAAHDFQMAMGTGRVVLTRAARAGDAPAVASRWLQRLLAAAEGPETEAMKRRGSDLVAWARELDALPDENYVPRPEPRPPVEARPRDFSVTEIETLRRDPYAVYARRILGLQPLEPLLRDPGAAERGTLFHDIIHAFSTEVPDPAAHDAADRLLEIARRHFDALALPPDIDAVWWPRFVDMAPRLVEWERERPRGILSRHAELAATRTQVGVTGGTLRGRADRIDLRPAGMADILDFKTGATPSKGQAHTLLAPQLALEGALLMRGAFDGLGQLKPAELAYVRLRPNGRVDEESILSFNRQDKSAVELSDEAWERLEKLLSHYNSPGTGYLSRALPFRAEEMGGDYDHLARTREWSAGVDGEPGGSE
ncbi:MAG: double-strand break repair protein AddB [Rhizobiaceae bacterium]